MRPELEAKVAKSIERLKAFEPPEGYYLAFSGGKDSIVCKQLLIESGCKFDGHYRVTSVDPPELVRYIKKYHFDIARDVPRDKDGKPITMWNLIPRKLMPPTRLVRYCCEQLKEGGGDGRMVVTGVRWAESPKRKANQGIVTMPNKKAGKEFKDDENFRLNKYGGVVLVNDNADSRRMIERCYTRHKTTVNPIIDWGDRDVWEYIKDRQIPYCELYDRGYERLGCVGCPLGKNQISELDAYPKIKNAYIYAFGKMLETRKDRGKQSEWRNAMEVYHWWVKDGIVDGQIDIFEEAEDEP